MTLGSGYLIIFMVTRCEGPTFIYQQQMKRWLRTLLLMFGIKIFLQRLPCLLGDFCATDYQLETIWLEGVLFHILT